MHITYNSIVFSLILKHMDMVPFTREVHKSILNSIRLDVALPNKGMVELQHGQKTNI